MTETLYNQAVVDEDVTAVGVLGSASAFSVQVNITGASSPVGTFAVQASNDGGGNWVEVSGSSIAVTANASHLLNFSGAGYEQVRGAFTLDSGSCTAEVVFCRKGKY
jgi:hypothetical protein